VRISFIGDPSLRYGGVGGIVLGLAYGLSFTYIHHYPNEQNKMSDNDVDKDVFRSRDGSVIASRRCCRFVSAPYLQIVESCVCNAGVI
jgi:hypothetical protein